MSYKTQALLAQDNELLIRVASCASTQGVPGPVGWAYDRQWKLSSQPGWDEAYAYALSSNVEDAGNDETVITDAMILSAVQSILADEV